MATKTFTAGSVLTAADTNTYLANSGLVYINSVNSSGNPSSLASPANVFSSTYDAYRIVISNLAVNTDTGLALTFGSTAAGYYYASPLSNMSTGAFDYDKGANVAYIRLGAVLTGTLNTFSFDVIHPNKSTPTRVTGFGYINSFAYGGVGSGALNNTTSYTTCTVSVIGGTMSSCTMTIYGYRMGNL